jgi:ribA/ribD-fused uncharacterized protein
MAIRFYSKSPVYARLSNFAEHGGFSLEGESWKSDGHYYRAMKFPDAELRSRIRSADSPLKARKIAANRDLSPRPDRDALKEGVMREALRAKLGRNRRLRKLLLETGETDLEHESPSDLSRGRTREDEGLNLPGKRTAEVRAELRRENQ